MEHVGPPANTFGVIYERHSSRRRGVLTLTIIYQEIQPGERERVRRKE